MHQLRLPLLVSILFCLCLPAMATPDFSAVEPRVQPVRENDSEPLRQGRTYRFSLERETLRADLQQQVEEAARRSGDDPRDYRAEILEFDDVQWLLVDEDLNKTDIRPNFPDLVQETRGASGLESCRLTWPFFLPTDPREGYILVVSSRLKWNVLRNNNPLFSPARAGTHFGKLHLRILDLEPPSAFRFDPDILHGFCGGRLSEFNERTAALAVADRYPANPAELVITFFDDNPFGFSATPGQLHHRDKAGAWLLLETWEESWTPADPPRGENGDWFDVTAMSGEASHGGRRVWTAPIPLASIPGSAVEVEAFGPEHGRRRIGWRTRIPLTGLEEYLQTHHPAFARLPLHWSSRPGPDGRLRFTVALADSSGNMIIPNESVLPDPQARAALQEIFQSRAAGRHGPVLQEHEVSGSLQVLDAIRPNAVLVVTNARSGSSAAFTLPNGDTAPNPWADDEEEWLFHYDGTSGAMKKLPPAERSRLAALLQVAENDRLLFQVAAWDNVGRDQTDPATGSRHGIITPLVGDPATPSLLRYQTFTIKDPGAISREDTIEETRNGVEIYRYPDYVFRSSGAGDPSVSFYVHDASLFRDPTRDAAAVPLQDRLALANRRAIRLVFSVRATQISTERLGGEEKLRQEK